ncbi:MAG: hypothetical protein V4615_11540 [Bacteroidota bacterium]
MQKTVTVLLVFFSAISFAQSDSTETLRIYKTASGKDFITVEYYSLKKQMYAKCEVLRTDGKKAVSLGEFGNKYSHGDTVIFFYTDTKVSPNTLYQYAFIPMKATGEKGTVSKPVFVSTKVFTGYYFKNTIAKPASHTLGVEVNWKLSSIDNIKAINLFRSEKSDAGFALLSTVPSTDTVYIDETVIPDKPYFYKLSAQNFITNELFESASFFDLGMPVTKPLKPVIQNVVQSSRGIEVKISVTENYLAGVHLYRKREADEKFSIVSSVKSDSVVTIIDSSVLSFSGDYLYAAKTENAARIESDFSNEASIHVSSVITVDYAGDFSAEYDNTTIKLFWDKLQFAQFKIKRIEIESKKQIWLNDGSPFIGNRFIDTAVLPARKYEYVLYPLNEIGNIGKGISAFAETSADDLVNNQSLRGFGSSQGIVLEWGAIADQRIAKQKLYRYQSGLKPTAIATLDLTAANYKDKTIRAGELYRYYLVSIDSKGKEGKPGNEIAVRAK